MVLEVGLNFITEESSFLPSLKEKNLIAIVALKEQNNIKQTPSPRIR